MSHISLRLSFLLSSIKLRVLMFEEEGRNMRSSFSSLSIRPLIIPSFVLIILNSGLLFLFV